MQALVEARARVGFDVRWLSMPGGVPSDDVRAIEGAAVMSGAKLGAPMGIGAVRVPSRVFYEARKTGMPLESESAPWLMAVGAACAAREAREARRGKHLTATRARADELLEGLRAIAPGLLVNGAAKARLGPLVNVSFPGQYGNPMVAALSLEGVCIS